MKNLYKNHKDKIAIVIVLLVVGVVWGSSSSGEKTATSTPETVSTEKSATSAGQTPTKGSGAKTSTTVSTGALKTYYDKKYGFTFEYPSQYNLTPSGSLVGPSGTELYFGAIFTTKNGEVASDNVASFLLDRRLPNSGTEYINGNNWQKDPWSAKYYISYTLRTGGLTIGFAVPEETQETLLRQVVRSFKFVKLSYPRLDSVLTSLKVGDSFGLLKVSAIRAGGDSKLISPDNFEVEFSGQLILRGYYDVVYLTSRTLVCATRFDTESVASLPKLDGSYDYKNIKICFDYNDFFAKSSIKEEEGSAGIVVEGVVETFAWNKAPEIRASVVSVIQ